MALLNSGLYLLDHYYYFHHQYLNLDTRSRSPTPSSSSLLLPLYDDFFGVILLVIVVRNSGVPLSRLLVLRIFLAVVCCCCIIIDGLFVMKLGSARAVMTTDKTKVVVTLSLAPRVIFCPTVLLLLVFHTVFRLIDDDNISGPCS